MSDDMSRQIELLRAGAAALDEGRGLFDEDFRAEHGVGDDEARALVTDIAAIMRYMAGMADSTNLGDPR